MLKQLEHIQAALKSFFEYLKKRVEEIQMVLQRILSSSSSKLPIFHNAQYRFLEEDDDTKEEYQLAGDSLDEENNYV